MQKLKIEVIVPKEAQFLTFEKRRKKTRYRSFEIFDLENAKEMVQINDNSDITPWLQILSITSNNLLKQGRVKSNNKLFNKTVQYTSTILQTRYVVDKISYTYVIDILSYE